MPTITREALYDEVWTDAVRTVAARYGISDVGLKKRCAAADIPVPERGYWAKLAAGKKVTRTPLPPRSPGAPDSVTFGKEAYHWNADPEVRLAEPVPEIPLFPEPIESVRARVERRVTKIPYVRDLASPWGSIRKLLEADEARREKQRTSKYPSPWDDPLFDSGFERRRLRVLNSLALGLAKAGAKLEISGKVARDLSVLVGSTRLGLTLDHPKAKPTRHGEWEARPGREDDLRLRIGGQEGRAEGYRAVWEDGAGSKLEAELTAIAIEIIVAGEIEHRAAARRHYEWQLERRRHWEDEVRKRREDAERKANERRLAEEKARRDLLFGQANAWRQAQDIRGFIAAVLGDPPKDRSPEHVQAWAAWAGAEANALDPLTSKTLVLPTGSNGPADNAH
jgi:hypothetical protein